jgi:hypothetical protein
MQKIAKDEEFSRYYLPIKNILDFLEDLLSWPSGIIGIEPSSIHSAGNQNDYQSS